MIRKLGLGLVMTLALTACGGGDGDNDISVSRSAHATGKLCGIPGIEGSRVGRVSDKVKGCGLNDAVRVEAVSGVSLSQGAVVDCGTAKSLNDWVRQVAKPALRSQGGGLERLHVAAHYVCRTRNHKKGARISEHGQGRAIDISGFYLKDGTEISVLRDWGKGKRGKALKTMRKGACGGFGTVLGPGSDRHHSDHFHFDTARHRNGPYCR